MKPVCRIAFDHVGFVLLLRMSANSGVDKRTRDPELLCEGKHSIVIMGLLPESALSASSNELVSRNAV